MAKTNKVAIPRVPKSVDREVQLFLSRVKEQTEILGGKGRASELDRALTLRDFQEAVGGQYKMSLTDILRGDDGDNPLYGDPIPLRPTGFKAYPTFSTVLLEWDRAARANWFFSTEIWRQTVHPHNREDIPEDEELPVDFGEAVLLGTTSSPLYTDEVPSETTVIYWVRHLNRDLVAGPFHETLGTKVTTYANPREVLEEYSKDLYEGENYAWLRSSIDMMDSIQRAYDAAGFGDSGLAQALKNSESLSDLLAEQAMMDALDKQTQRSEIKAQFSKNYAKLSGGVHAAVNLNEAYVNRIQTLEAAYGQVGEQVKARLDEYEVALAGENGVVASTIKNYSVDYQGNAVTLQTLAQTLSNVDGENKAQWGVKTNVNDLKGGVGFLNDGEVTSFVVDAQRFAVTGDTEDETIAPLIVRDNRVVMNEALIDTAVIYDLIAKNVTAEKLRATIDIASPKINGGSITGTTINVNDRAYIDQYGRLTALDGFFKGTVQATNGYLENMEVRENCIVRGTVFANKIEGDVIDRIVVNVPSDREIHAYQRYVMVSGDIIPGQVGEVADRYLTVTGAAFDHNGGSGGSSNFDVVLYMDSIEQQRFHSKNVEEEGSVTPTLGCLVPKSGKTRSFELVLEVGDDDNIMVQQSSVIADITRAGTTLKNIKSLYHTDEREH